ncbi:MAG: MaoC family dehydratase [Variovorax sp.]
MSHETETETPLHGPLHSASLDALVARVGQELGVSRWFAVDQPRIQRFAETTNDHYFLHLDPERARAGPFGGTIAHGFLSLSLVAPMAYDVCPAVEGARATLNYGFDKIRFLNPVPSGRRVRGRFVLKDVARADPKKASLHYLVTVEIEGEARPALVADWINLVML